MFDVNKSIPFGKYKGKSWKEVSTFEAGQNWLRWLIDQPNTDEKYKTANEVRNAALEELLIAQNVPSEARTEPKAPNDGRTEKERSEDSFLGVMQNSIVDLQTRVRKIEQMFGKDKDEDWTE